MKPQITSPALLTDRDVANLLNVGRATVWRWVAEGRLPQPKRIARTTRWRLTEIEAFLNEQEAA